MFRAEFRTFMSPFPEKVLATVPGGHASGWLYNFVPLFGFSATY
jgi:hypothetical protein